MRISVCVSECVCACVHVCVSHVYRLLSLFFQTDRHLKCLLCDKLAFKKTDFRNYLCFGGNFAVDVEFFSLKFNQFQIQSIKSI